MPNKNSTLTWRWMKEVWNEGRETAIDEMLDANAIIHGIEGITAPGPEGFKAFYHSFKEQFPQVNVEVEAVVSEENVETSRCTVRAVSVSGQEVNFTGMLFVHIQNGKIVEAWNNFDFLSMHQQLGFKIAPPEEMTA